MKVYQQGRPLGTVSSGLLGRGLKTSAEVVVWWSVQSKQVKTKNNTDKHKKHVNKRTIDNVL